MKKLFDPDFVWQLINSFVTLCEGFSPGISSTALINAAVTIAVGAKMDRKHLDMVVDNAWQTTMALRVAQATDAAAAGRGYVAKGGDA